MKLCEMAQEYRVNVALLELRIKQLQAAQKSVAELTIIVSGLMM